MASNVRPKIVVAVNADIDVQNSDEVEWAISFRSQPSEDVIIVDHLPAGPLDPCILDSIPLDARTASSIGIDATYPFGSIVDTGAGEEGQGPAKTADKLYFKVAEVPGWQDYSFPELDQRR
jgi:4-hydroxy-3-polyprenylbenzoate decarboxylase/2,5-furandicarboxylate decarboxylase 1